MADLSDILPGFDQQPWRYLTYSLQKKNITTAELISQDPLEIARRCPLPLKEVKRMAVAVNQALQADLELRNTSLATASQYAELGPPRKRRKTKEQVEGSAQSEMRFVRTLDPDIDQCLGGGFPTGNICEVVGESAAGKTQLVLSLLLTAQLPAPKGLGRAVLYLSTEDELNTARLREILDNNSKYEGLPIEDRPTMDRVYTMSVRNFDQQENIIQYKLPFLVENYDIGLVVIDSVAANFRIRFPGGTPAVLGRRAVALGDLGRILRRVAHDYNVAVVVTNQVADRFEESRVVPDRFRVLSSPSSSLSVCMIPSLDVNGIQLKEVPPNGGNIESTQAVKDEVMSLDYQQCFFTGWGDDSERPFETQKNPTLGLAWANQIDARVVLKIVHDMRPTVTENIYADHRRRRFLNVVFAPWAPPTAVPVEYELRAQGLASIPLLDGQPYGQTHEFDNDDDDSDNGEPSVAKEEYQEFLDPKYWEDDPNGDDDFL